MYFFIDNEITEPYYTNALKVIKTVEKEKEFF